MSTQKFTESRPSGYGTISSTGGTVNSQQSNGVQRQLSTTSQDFDREAQHGVYVSFSNFSDEEDDEEERDYRTLLNEYLITTPLIILALISFVILLYAWPSIADNADRLYEWDIFLLGALGYCFVLFLRKPIFFTLLNLMSLKISYSSFLTLILIGFVGEIVRFGWLSYFGSDGDEYKFLTAYWLGLGWASAEALYFIMQNFIELRWYKDEMEMNGKYTAEREELEEVLGRPLTKVSAWWGVMWRFSWIMAHIGFSCWIAYIPLLVYPAAFIHGLLLVLWGYCLPVFGIPGTSYVTLIISMSVFLVGLGLFGQIV